MVEQIVGSAVDGLGGDDVVPGLGEVEYGVGDGRGSGCDGESGASSLEGGDPLLEDLLGRVGQTAVDVPGVLESETVGGMLRVVEDVGRGQVDRNRPGVGDGVGLLLPHMELEGLESLSFRVVRSLGYVVGHGFHLCLNRCMVVRYINPTIPV